MTMRAAVNDPVRRCRGPATIIGIAFFWALCGGFAPPCAAQSIYAQPRHSSPRLHVGEDQSKTAAWGTNRDEVGLSELVDPRSYRLTPGDELILSIGGAVDLTLALRVTADGMLVVPSIGAVSVGKATLAEARTTLAAAAAKAYPRSSISLALVRPGLLRIPVTGQVASPGSHTLPATSRLCDWIARAGGFLASADARHVELRRSGETTCHDVLAWLVDGRIDGNPRLHLGDHIHVPATRAGFRVRGVFAPDGGAATAGRLLDRPFQTESRLIPFRTGDRLDFALRASGWPGDQTCDLGVWLLHPGEARRWVAQKDLPETALAAADVIEIPFCHDWIAVGGAVGRPGVYPFLPGQRAADYVFLAGGPSPIGRSKDWKRFDAQGAEIPLAPTDTLLAGERIWVPERRSHKIASLLTPLGTVVAVIVSVVALASSK